LVWIKITASFSTSIQTRTFFIIASIFLVQNKISNRYRVVVVVVVKI
jgi:hypothetical protein